MLLAVFSSYVVYQLVLMKCEITSQNLICFSVRNSGMYQNPEETIIGECLKINDSILNYFLNYQTPFFLRSICREIHPVNEGNHCWQRVTTQLISLPAILKSESSQSGNLFSEYLLP